MKRFRTVINKYKNLLNEIDEAYRCIRTLIIDDNLIDKLEFIFKKHFFVEN